MFAKAIVHAAMLSGMTAAAIATLAGSWGGGEPLVPIAAVALATTNVPAAAAVLPTISGTDRHSDGLFYVQAQVNGKPIRFMLDTGASYTVLTDADARAAGIMLDKDRFDGHVSTVGGDTAMAWTRLDRIELAGHDVRGLRAVVVRNGLGVSLLGQNMLEKLDSVTLKAGRLHLR